MATFFSDDEDVDGANPVSPASGRVEQSRASLQSRMSLPGRASIQSRASVHSRTSVHGPPATTRRSFFSDASSSEAESGLPRSQAQAAASDVRRLRRPSSLEESTPARPSLRPSLHAQDAPSMQDREHQEGTSGTATPAASPKESAELESLRQQVVVLQAQLEDARADLTREERTRSSLLTEQRLLFDAERARLELELQERAPMGWEDQRARIQRLMLAQVQSARSTLEARGRELVEGTEQLAQENEELEEQVRAQAQSLQRQKVVEEELTATVERLHQEAAKLQEDCAGWQALAAEERTQRLILAEGEVTRIASQEHREAELRLEMEAKLAESEGQVESLRLELSALRASGATTPRPVRRPPGSDSPKGYGGEPAVRIRALEELQTVLAELEEARREQYRQGEGAGIGAERQWKAIQEARRDQRQLLLACGCLEAGARALRQRLGLALDPDRDPEVSTATAIDDLSTILSCESPVSERPSSPLADGWNAVDDAVLRLRLEHGRLLRRLVGFETSLKGLERTDRKRSWRGYNWLQGEPDQALTPPSPTSPGSAWYRKSANLAYLEESPEDKRFATYTRWPTTSTLQGSTSVSASELLFRTSSTTKEPVVSPPVTHFTNDTAEPVVSFGPPNSGACVFWPSEPTAAPPAQVTVNQEDVSQGCVSNWAPPCISDSSPMRLFRHASPLCRSMTQ